MALTPPLSVIICTRNRAAGIVHAANAVLASDYPDFELLIVDESDNSATADALATLGSNSLRHLPLAARGKAQALNYALQNARGEFLALTDDDCEMAPDCLSAIVAAFARDDGIGVVFGNVVAAPHDQALEHIPAREVNEPNTISQPADFLRISARRSAPWVNFGIGANMAVRAAAVRGIGGWDPCIGPGEKFGSGDDHDLAFRMLQAGHAVHFCPASRALHHGARPRSRLRRDHHRVGRGFGAAFAKHLKCGILYRGSGRTVPFHLARLCAGSLNGKRSDSAGFLAGWASGFCGGLGHAVEKSAARFEDCRDGGEF